MKTRLTNARILTMIPPYEIFKGEIWIANDRITYIGPSKKTNEIFDLTKNLKGNLVIPGFKNAHSHSAMTFLRSAADGLSLQRWLQEVIFPMEAKLQPTDIYHLSKLAFAEYLTSGITASFDMYYHLDQVGRAAKDSGFRVVLLGSVSSTGDRVEKLKRDFETLNHYDPLVSYVLGFHAEHTTSEEVLKDLSKLSNQLKVPVFTHISETKKEVEDCITRHGTTPPMYMERLGLFNYGGGGFHCVYLSEDDIALFKRRRLHVVSCPGSNTKIASGIAPIQKYIDAGLNLSLGTDGPASNNALDMFKEIQLTFSLQIVSTKDPKATPAEKLLEMATVGGAKAMGLKDADVLAVGKLADLTVIDLNTPEMQPLIDIIKNVIYSGGKHCIKMTMVAGKILYENGKFFLDEPIQDIYRKAQEITDRIKNS